MREKGRRGIAEVVGVSFITPCAGMREKGRGGMVGVVGVLFHHVASGDPCLSKQGRNDAPLFASLTKTT